MTELEYKIRIAKLESLTTAKELEAHIRKLEIPKFDENKSEFDNIHIALRYMRLTTQAFHMFKEKSVKQLPDYLYGFNSNIKFSVFWIFFEYTEFNKTIPYEVFLDYFKYCKDVLYGEQYKSIRILPLVSKYIKDKEFPINIDNMCDIGNNDYYTTNLYNNLLQDPKRQYTDVSYKLKAIGTKNTWNYTRRGYIQHSNAHSAISGAIQRIVELEIEVALFTKKERIIVDKVINGIKTNISKELLKSDNNKYNTEKDIQTRLENIQIFDKNFQRSKKKIYSHLEELYNESKN